MKRLCGRTLDGSDNCEGPRIELHYLFIYRMFALFNQMNATSWPDRSRSQEMSIRQVGRCTRDCDCDCEWMDDGVLPYVEHDLLH